MQFTKNLDHTNSKELLGNSVPTNPESIKLNCFLNTSQSTVENVKETADPFKLRCQNLDLHFRPDKP